MASPPYREFPGDLTPEQHQPMLEQNTWRGGPRPPLAGKHRRGLTWDDLDAMLHSNRTQYIIDRASRRYALDPETEQRWRRLLQLRGPSLPQPGVAPWPSSAVDSRVSFFGPREPRRTPRSRNSPLTPHTPFTPFTPFTPDTPELVTPHDLVPDPNEPNGKRAQADAEQSSFSALEHQITPFPLWEYNATPPPLREHDGNSRTQGSTAHTLDTASLSYASSPPSRPSLLSSPTEATPQRRWWVVNATAQDVETISGSLLTPFGSPSPMEPEPSSSSTHTRSSRPQLSINTSLETSPNPRASNGARFRNGPPRSAVAESSFMVPSNIPSNNNRFSIESLSPLSYTSALDHQSRLSPRAPTLTYDMDNRQSFTVTDSSDIIPRLIARLTTDVLQDKFKYKALLSHRGDEAQLTLDTLQLLLDSLLLNAQDRTMILKALTRLSTKSGLYPHCFKLGDVKTLGSEAIDEGRYGDVWKAISHDQVVCLKVLRTYQRMPTQPLLKMLSNEALLWGQLSHPNILPFYGIHFGEVRRSRFGLVSPWMDNGNVVNYLKANPHVSRSPLIHDVACGLKYLHSLDIVHGDIKGTNILVTFDGRACLADFGLSTILGDNILIWSSEKSLPGSGGGTTRWKAPELFIQESLDAESTPTPATDVYSFACAAYEILTDQIPFYEVRGDAAVTLKLFRSRAKPSRPPADKAGKGIGELTDSLWRLLEDCWNHEPDERPSLDEVLERLEMVMELRRVRIGDLDSNVALSSSSFRRSVTPLNRPSNNDLLKVLSMISVKLPT